MSFFDTKEYHDLRVIYDRLKIINTPDNLNAFNKQRYICLVLAKEKYENVGWNDTLKKHRWDSFDSKNIAPPMKKMESKLFCQTMYVALDGSQVVFKVVNGKYVKYSKEELEKLHGLKSKDKMKIHDIKIMFEGEIIERKKHSTKN